MFVLISILIAIENIIFFYLSFKRYKIINITNFSLVFLFIMYCIVPVSYYYGFLDIHKMYKVSFSDEQVANLHIIANLLIFIFYTIFFMGYFIKKKFYIEIKDTMTHCDLKSFTVSIFVFSLISFIIYVYIYGGLDYILENISHIRSGKDENKSYLGSFARMFTEYLFIVVMVSFYYTIRPEKLSGMKTKSIKALQILFYILLVVLLMKKFIDGGRGGLLTVFVSLFIMYNLVYKRIRWKYLLTISFFSFMIIFYGKTVLFQLFTDNFQNIEVEHTDYIEKFLLEFSYPYISLLNAIYLDLSMDRLFMDFYIWMFKLLKIYNIEGIDSISYYNTYHLVGVWTSSIPPGIVGFLFLEGGVLFIPFGAFFLGIVFAKLDYLVYHLSNSNNPLLLAISVLFITKFLKVMGNADIALVIQSMLVYILLVLYMYFVGYIRIIKIKI